MGEIVLITPEDGYDPATGRGKVTETICRPGDVVMQRGTLHAYLPLIPDIDVNWNWHLC